MPDEPDSRDLPLVSATLDAVRPRAHTVDRGQPPKDQDGTGSCCGQGVSAGIQLAHLALDIQCPELSALFDYYNARRYGTTTPTDGGTSVRAALKAAKKFGVSTERAWPMRPSYVNRKPAWNAYRLAFDFRGVRGYYRIDKGNIEGVRTAIANGLPVVAWWRVDTAFKSIKGPTVIGPCDPKSIVGNHCMLIVSYYDNGEFGILNSWGSRWRNNGRQRVTPQFIEQGMDKWAIDVRR